MGPSQPRAVRSKVERTRRMAFSAWSLACLGLVVCLYLRDSGLWVSSTKSGGSMEEEFSQPLSVPASSVTVGVDGNSMAGVPKLSRRKTLGNDDDVLPASSLPAFRNLHIKFCQS